MDPPLCIGITLTIFISLGNTPVENDLLIIYASGIIIKSGIKDNNLNGILEGPVDLSGPQLIFQRINYVKYLIIGSVSNNKVKLNTIF